MHDGLSAPMSKAWLRWWRRVAGRVFGRESPRPVLVLVEGLNDVEFLRRISRILAEADPARVDLTRLEQAGEVVLLPLGGNGPQPWMCRLASLGRAAFYLFDRETSPTTEHRRVAAAELNSRPRQRAFVTEKRSLENYLHPQAIFNARGVQIMFGDESEVAELAARDRLSSKGVDRPWNTLSVRTRKRLRDQAKRWLNREAVDRMTPSLLAERDSAGEVLTWLATIADLVERSH